MVELEASEVTRFTFAVCCTSKAIAALLVLTVGYYLRQEKRRVLHTGASAKPLLILPVYEPLLQALIPGLLLEIWLFYESVYGLHFWADVLGWAWFSWLREGFAFTFLSPSASRAAFKRAFQRSFVMPLATVPCVLVTVWSPLAASFLIQCPPIAFYAVILAGKLYSRPALRTWSKLMLVYRLCWISYGLACLQEDPSVSNPLIAFILAFIALCEVPWMLMVYYTLLQDTWYWRGYRPPKALTLLNLPLLSGDVADSVLSTSLQSLMEEHRSSLIDFSLVTVSAKKLGAGGTANVYQGFLQRTPVAIKMFAPMELTSDEVELYSQETAIAVSLQHPRVVRMYGVCVMPPVLCLLFELCAWGSLFDVIRSSDPDRGMDVARRVSVARQCAEGLQFMHQRGLVHRDLKSMNYLVQEGYEVKLTDFGLARMLPLGDGEVLAVLPSEHPGSGGGVALPEDVQTLTSGIGTLQWMAPEMLRGGLYSNSADIWSLGMVFYEIMTGRVPFDDVVRNAADPTRELYEAVTKHGQLPSYRAVVRTGALARLSAFRGSEAAGASGGGRGSGSLEEEPMLPETAPEKVVHELCLAMWSADPEQRPSIEQVLAWLPASSE